MVLTGYPPMDLLERDGFVRDQLRELEALAPASRRDRDRARRRAAGGARGPAAPPERGGAARRRRGARGAAKTLLPTYDVFDEKR